MNGVLKMILHSVKVVNKDGSIKNVLHSVKVVV